MPVVLAFLLLLSLQVVLPLHLEKIRDRLAENIHELWGMNKIELGWTFGKVCASMARPSGVWYSEEGFLEHVIEDGNL